MSDLSVITEKLMTVSNEILTLQGLSNVDQCLRDASLEWIDSMLDDLDGLRDESIKELIDMGHHHELGDREVNLIQSYSVR